MKKKVTIGILILGFLIPVTTRPVEASMQSESYELQMPNLNFVSGMGTSPNFKLGYTGGELAVGPYSSTGYKVWAGFWYLKSIIPFSFSVSNQVVEFSTLSANEPETATTTLTVSAGGSGGYQVTVEENHEMMVYSLGALIPDVAGDNNDITENVAGTWNLTTTYGFGYSLYGNDVVTPFPTAAPGSFTTFKQFPNINKSETPKIIMSSTKVGKNRSAVLVYKINVSPSQEAGRYQNVITYVATPTY